jgi:hypothetical protein
MLDLQLADTLKARILDADQVNQYADGAATGAVASQEDIRRYLGGMKSREG